MQWNGREYKEVELSNGDRLLTLEKFKGKEYVRVTKLFGQKDSYAKENMMSKVPELAEIFCVILTPEDKEKPVVKTFDNLDLDDVAIVSEAVGLATEQLFDKIAEKKA